MKTLRTYGLYRLVILASMLVLCVAIGLLGTQQRAEGWSAGPLYGVDMPPGGAHGMMAEDAVLWLDLNKVLPTNYLSAKDRQLLRDGASTPDSIWGVGIGFKYAYWWEGAVQLEGMIDREIVTWDVFGYSCTDEPCFTLKDDWENDKDNLMNHEFAKLSEWNPIKYWADKAKQDLNNDNRSRAMVHAGYAMHFAMDYLNPPHLGPLMWDSYQEVEWPYELEFTWESSDYYYIPKARSGENFQLFGRCIISDGGFPISIENDLLSYRHSNALAWPAPLPSLDWIHDQGHEGVLLDQRIANAVMWSEQVAIEVLQYVLDFKICVSPPGGDDAGTLSFKESYVDKVQAFREEGETWHEETQTGKFNATFKLNLNPIFPVSKTENITKQFNGTTCFNIALGAIQESFCLGDGGDVKYTEGKTSATVSRRENVGELGENRMTIMKTTAKWTAKNVLTINMSGNAAWLGWILADNYEGMTVPAIEDTASAFMTITGTFIDKNGVGISSVYAFSDVSVTGMANTKTVVKGPDEEEFDLTTVSLTGQGTVAVSYD